MYFQRQLHIKIEISISDYY